MRIAAIAMLYLFVGCCAAAWRAYREPELTRRYYCEEHHWQNLWESEAAPHTFGYPDLLAAYIFGWPIALPVMLVAEFARRMEARGRAAMLARIAIEEERRKGEQEIDRIIREHAL